MKHGNSAAPAGRILRRSLVAAAAGGAALAAFAQGGDAYPSKALRLIVPTGPGGGADVVSRLLATYLAKHLGQAVAVENVPGAGGILGASRLQTAAPDGYTVLFSLNNIVTINEHLFSKMPYDPAQFKPVCVVAKAGYALLAARDFPASNVAELIALAKREPGRIAYGSIGNGSAQHLGMELFKQMAGIDLLHVPYKTAGAAQTDLAGGQQIQLLIDPLASSTALVRGGRVKALASTTPQRAASLPDVPTVGETVPGYALMGWNGLWVPPGTPDAIVATLQKAAAAATAESELVTRLREISVEAQSSTPAEAAALRASETAAWGKLIRDKGIRVE